MEQSGQVLSNRDHSNLTSIQKFLKSDPDNIMDTEKMEFLSDVRNPCFAESDYRVDQGKMTLKLALDEKWRIHCLPAFYLAGTLLCVFFFILFLYFIQIIYIFFFGMSGGGR